MSVPAASQAPWVHLGEMLQDRRVELDTRYANLRLFTDEAGIDYRLAWDVEHAARVNYRRPTLTAIEVAYRWGRGSIAAVLAGGAPVLLDPEPKPSPPAPDPRGVTSEVLDKLEEVIRFSRRPPAERDDPERASNGA